MDGPTQDVHRALFVVEPGARVVAGGGAIESVAALAAVNLGILAELLRDLVRGSVPALQVPDAELAFGVPLIAGALPGLLLFDLHVQWTQLLALRFGQS